MGYVKSSTKNAVAQLVRDVMQRMLNIHLAIGDYSHKVESLEQDFFDSVTVDGKIVGSIASYSAMHGILIHRFKDIFGKTYSTDFFTTDWLTQGLIDGLVDPVRKTGAKRDAAKKGKDPLWSYEVIRLTPEARLLCEKLVEEGL